jgi:hypothetical protein
MSECCFGVEQRGDGSVVVAAQSDEDLSIERFAPGRAESSAVVRFVRQRSRAPRVCVAATGDLPDAEVILIRPAALPRASEATVQSASDDSMVLALARYARRVA